MTTERRTYRSFGPDFRRHYQTTQKADKFSYVQYEPAYRYGYDLAMDRRFRHRAWSEIEAEIRTTWEMRYGETWEIFAEAVHHAWDAVRETLPDANNPVDPTFEALRDHYEVGYAERGYPTTAYETAYRYGYFLAADERYRDLDWAEIEPEVRRNWRNQGEESWESFSKAVQDGWTEVKRRLLEVVV